jgi:hypothetical protein
MVLRTLAPSDLLKHSTSSITPDKPPEDTWHCFPSQLDIGHLESEVEQAEPVPVLRAVNLSSCSRSLSFPELT